ncbi:poly [ADP-ribose] polymerase 14-like isoform X2 [Pomacea canaliculata]|uniref:poly [ADP-ribose] polymerase 14-like isoform X2 n=1 Tax=Pomacea canaliculata TaxID=400727 RepID=UPI000D725439|nr:poly [ADP-ribose] polymerase 14-like isoform X2 [Pomacea canaliculata]
MPGPDIRIISGNIALTKADVIVSTTHPCLDLRKGIMSRVVLQHAGDSIQKELQTYLVAYGRPQLGQVVYTSGGKLSCQHLYHLSLPTWQDDKGQVLQRAIEKCLDLAGNQNANSIAFPTLGVGFLGYPPDVSASILFTTINSWCLKNNAACLKEVLLVVFSPDTVSLNVFNSEATRFLQQQQGGALGCITLGSAAPAGQFQAQSVNPLQNPATVGQGRTGALGLLAYRPPQFQAPLVFQAANPVTVGLAVAGHQQAGQLGRSSPPQGRQLQHKSRPTIRIISGEIAKASVDVIVSTVPPGLNMLKGVMSRSVLQLGGNSIQQELQAYLMTHGCAQMGKVVCTSGGQLQCQYVYHLSLPEWQSDNGQTLKSAVKECLDTAKQHAAKSIAFPTLGAGFLGYPLHRVATILLNSIYSWVDRHRGCRLQEVQIIVFTKDTAGLQVFTAVQDSINDSKGLTRTGSGRQSSKQKQSSSPQAPQATSGNATVVSQPSHWEPMNGDNVKLVDLDPSSTEYQQVVGLSRGMAVESIQRVQNPTLYQQYRAKKRDMKMNNSSNTANEQQLWHGTNAANISSIITNGFNRGYCGQNGTKFGHGVYFATNADFSNSYTLSGTIFLALVLVGESTPGNSQMRVPPKKPGSDRLYDSVTGPDMVVIFHDAQAYPQYLVTLQTQRSWTNHVVQMPAAVPINLPSSPSRGNPSWNPGNSNSGSFDSGDSDYGDNDGCDSDDGNFG